MKRAQFHIAGLTYKPCGLLSVAVLAILMTGLACSHNSTPTVASSQPLGASLRPAVLQTGAPAVSRATLVTVASETSSPTKPVSSQMIAYKSRDYGVSFLYPWQYAFSTAKSLANGDSQPKSEGLFTLARVEIPRGYYPDTDFQSGYFTLSLNEDLTEQECQSTLNPAKVETDTINGVEFRWAQTETGGRGNASTIRNYSAFTNGTCYQVEMGVKSKNERGLAREVDADQVLQRLDRILRTVKILPVTQNVAEPQTGSSTQAPSAN
jgi:hypothetical protein